MEDATAEHDGLSATLVFFSRLGQAIFVFTLVRILFAPFEPTSSLSVDILKSFVSIAVAVVVVVRLAKARIRSKLWHRAWTILALLVVVAGVAGFLYVAAAGGSKAPSRFLPEVIRDVGELLVAVGLASAAASRVST